jgi:hypothetical protein
MSILIQNLPQNEALGNSEMSAAFGGDGICSAICNGVRKGVRYGKKLAGGPIGTAMAVGEFGAFAIRTCGNAYYDSQDAQFEQGIDIGPVEDDVIGGASGPSPLPTQPLL